MTTHSSFRPARPRSGAAERASAAAAAPVCIVILHISLIFETFPSFRPFLGGIGQKPHIGLIFLVKSLFLKVSQFFMFRWAKND